ncbi:hypothetical protein OHA27_31190 [Streptomyces sp. NBC_01619]|uniref:Uncharacterized protein n=1 Tax=Streptomyces pratisoli TaxID=3139917 RepID=A0ACC6QR06_9ACTN|nr:MULTISPECIES: hypothetical protein [unclassified Streptomyces]MCX4514713.1 hypothetical protein [Streptomyces sp. NBC_01619]
MANTSTRGRGVGSPARRSMTAAARAAAKRAHRPGNGEDGPDEATVVAGRTLRAEEPEPGAKEAELDWEAPDWEGPDPEEPDPEEPSSRGRRRRRGLLSAVLAVLALVALIATVVLVREYGDARQTDQARRQALSAAQKAAPVVLSYDYRHLDRDFAAARGHLTGAFRDEYGRTTAKVVAPTAKKYQGVVEATVAKPPGGGAPAASVVSASPDRAVVLLFVNQVTRSTQVSGPRVDLNRVRMTLTRTSEGWKVSAVDAL